MKTATGDAQITYEVLFKTTATVDITAKINFLANTNPNYQNIDGGIRRRLLVSLHKNRWLEQDEIDRRRAKGEDVSNIKVPDPKLLHKFDEESYKLAYFQILLPHAVAYYQKGLVICASMREETNNLVEDNDTMGEFLENCVEKTNNDDDKIGKDEFYMKYIETGCGYQSSLELCVITCTKKWLSIQSLKNCWKSQRCLRRLSLER